MKNEIENEIKTETKKPAERAWLAGFGGGIGTMNEPTEDFEY